jgi:predicted dehydrogenase
MKIVLIGNEGHTYTALNSIRANPELELCGVASANPVDRKNLDTLCEEFGCGFHDDYIAMLDELKPDVACIATRYDLNGVVSAECLRRGVNCYTEKSIAHSLDKLSELKQAASDGGARIIGMHTMRYDPHFYAAYKAVSSGAVGKPMMIYGRKSYKFGSSRPDFYRKREFYGSTILWVALHAIDLACWIGGEMDKVYGLKTSECNFDHGDCEASTAIAFSFKNGGIGAITADFYQPAKAPSHGDDQLRVAGEKGVVEVIDGKAFLTTHEQERVELPLEPEGDFFGDFCNELRGTAKCRLSMKDTFMVTEAALKANF